MASHFMEVVREIFFGTSGRRHIPNLDGAWRPNEVLEEAPRAGGVIDSPEDVAVDANGRVYVASGSRVLRLDGDQWAEIADLGGTVGALAMHGTQGLLAAVAGRGVLTLDGNGKAETVLALNGEDALCPNGLAVDAEGRVCLTLGSRRNGLDTWSRDLMEKGASGRLVRFTPGKTGFETLADGLAFPYGVAVRPGDGAILVSEAWKHRIVAVSHKGGAPQLVADNLVGYPTRLCSDGANGWWLSFLALRTQLVEFVLREDAFRTQMIASIRPDEWIAPRLRAEETPQQPQQLGALRNHGVKKPWAPPKSYGLVALLDAEFEPRASLHSRSNGTHHGITGLALHDGVLLVAAKGADAILRVGTDI